MASIYYDYKYYKDFPCIFDTPAKKAQEIALVSLIFRVLNRNIYGSIDELMIKNRSYDEFLKKYNFSNVVKHFGNTLNETDFIKICNNIKKFLVDKQTFSIDNVQTFNFDNKEYLLYSNPEEKNEPNSQIAIENNSKRGVEDILRDGAYNVYNTTDPEQNTQTRFEELKEDKENIKFKFLHEIVLDQLTEQERSMFDLAFQYQEYKNVPVKIDLARGLLLEPGEPDNIIKIEQVGSMLKLFTDDDPSKGTIIEEISGPQLTLTPSKLPSTIYTNNNDK